MTKGDGYKTMYDRYDRLVKEAQNMYNMSRLKRDKERLEYLIVRRSRFKI